MDAEMGSALMWEKKQFGAGGAIAKTLLLRGRAGWTVQAIMVVWSIRSFYSSLRAAVARTSELSRIFSQTATKSLIYLLSESWAQRKSAAGAALSEIFKPRG
jgi:hypothetical protein